MIDAGDGLLQHPEYKRCRRSKLQTKEMQVGAQGTGTWYLWFVVTRSIFSFHAVKIL